MMARMFALARVLSCVFRPAPARELRLAWGAALLGILVPVGAAVAQTAPRPAASQPAAPTTRAAPPAAAASAPARPSALSAELFYQLLVGELAARGTDPGAGFGLLLDAARKTNDPAVYQRATEIALQARAGESALQAAQAWRRAHPQSRDANRYLLQILLALNRVADTAEPLRALLAATPEAERAPTLSLVPRLYARAGDKTLAARVAEQALVEVAAQPALAAPAWTAIGRLRLAAGQAGPAVEAAQRAQAAGPQDEGPALLALDLLSPQHPQAEALVRRYLDTPSALPEVRMAYARTLLDAQRNTEAREQLQRITAQRPEFAEAWLLLGVLQVQDGPVAAGETSLQRFLQLSQAQAQAQAQARGRRDGQDRSLAQAFLALAQAAEKRGDLAAAGRWLDRIQSPQDLVATQNRRASLLARQGRLEDARQLLRALPERDPADARVKLLAELHLLREQKQYRAAYDLLAPRLSTGSPEPELLYEQAMNAEKLLRHDEMEQLLRQAIALKPDFHHAYNALGYSLADRNLRLNEAKDLIRKALEFAPGDPFITDSLGWVEFRLGNKAEAARLLEQAYRGRPDAEIAAHLGEVLWSLGQRDRALAIWREGLAVGADNETLRDTLKRLQVRP